jgi:FemAB-related protein (PEP-CTERM system-associated)
VTFGREITSDSDANLAAIPRKQRAMVRKGIQRGLQRRLDADVRDLYRMYAESLRNLGTPVVAKSYFQILCDTFRDDAEIVTITHEDQAVSSVLNFRFRDQILPYYGGGSTASRSLAANDFMYWQVMERARENGLRWFDFGRSKRETGAYDFKKNWGFEPRPLHYEYYLVRAQQMPNLSPTNPKYGGAIEIWKRLPLPIANAIGPLVAKYLG